jgi:hypothetical protein
MKKVKLMLLSLSVLAVVGGALAFTAKQTFRYCTAPTVSGQQCKNIACPTENARITTVDPTIFVCTAATIGGSQPCSGVNCETTSVGIKVE